jgi:uncharacterized OB-fold protein
MRISGKPWEGTACTKCGHYYLPGTKDGEYFTNSKPCLYCDNPHIGYKVQSAGCVGLFLLVAGVAFALAA